MKEFSSSITNFEASKWIKIQALLTKIEFQSLLSSLKGVNICPLGKVITEDELVLSIDDYVSQYDAWMQKCLKKEPASFFSAALTEDLKCLGLMETKKGYLLKVVEPVIQATPHFYRYSTVDHTIRPNVFSQDRIFWGIQFSFPMVFQNAEKELIETKQIGNYSLFSRLRKWVREETRPATFQIGNQKLVSTMRIGKQVSGKHLVLEIQ